MKLCRYCNIEFLPKSKRPHAITCASKSCQQKYKNEWARNNPKSKTDWIKRNPEKRALSSSNYMKRNRGYYNNYSALRARHKRQAQPKWLSEFDVFYMEELYDMASRRALEVDHIVPIKSKLVCGLHVPWNLQLLTRNENARKSNKLNEDVVCLLEDSNE